MTDKKRKADASVGEDRVTVDAYDFLQLQHYVLRYVESETEMARGLIADQEADATIPRSWASRSIINMAQMKINHMKEVAYHIRGNFQDHFDTPYLRTRYQFELSDCERCLEKFVEKIAWPSEKQQHATNLLLNNDDATPQSDIADATSKEIENNKEFFQHTE